MNIVMLSIESSEQNGRREKPNAKTPAHALELRKRDVVETSVATDNGCRPLLCCLQSQVPECFKSKTPKLVAEPNLHPAS